MKFEIELFDFEGEDISKDKDKSVVKRIKSNGEGYDHPNVRNNFLLVFMRKTFRYYLPNFIPLI